MTSSFPLTPRSFSHKVSLYSSADGGNNKNKGGGELPKPSSDIDWDGEWKKVQRGEIKPKEKGLEPPSELQKVRRSGEKER
ncbi:hypothetical protein TrRE_jg505 [Triparma retinervis]|uniref:Uncharacterized protein n=1 Tax=Triparma retinervis TaxID=2557542 RepID=A0A9W7AL12_9STRA|nr:hypothetical protein TrRE_jg505 [Triparma retinervis]